MKSHQSKTAVGLFAMLVTLALAGCSSGDSG